MWRLGAQFVELSLQPALQLVGRDGHTGVAADGELNHASIVDRAACAEMGVSMPSRGAQMGQTARDGLGPYGREPVPARAWKATMRSDPFLDFHRTAEAAGYPALLIVSMFALGLVVAPVRCSR